MLATRIIPTLLKRGRNLVKGEQFKSWRIVGHALQSVRTHNARGVDELIFLDIGATPEGRGPDFDLVAELTEDMFSPITVGGGVKSVADVKRLLAAGADKVSIGTAAVRTDSTDLLRECADEFGSQAIVASIDWRRYPQDGRFHDPMIWVECGMKAVMTSPVVTAMDYERRGAGEILLTSIDREGKMQGYDLELIDAVADAVSIPVIAHGGCGTPEHMLQAIRAGASAVAAGAMFQFEDITPLDCAKYLQEHGCEVRV